jgi:malate dehydrogenase
MNSDIVVITSGFPQPGMTRDDLKKIRRRVRSHTEVVKHSPNCIIIMGHKPSMQWLNLLTTVLPRSRVIDGRRNGHGASALSSRRNCMYLCVMCNIRAGWAWRYDDTAFAYVYCCRKLSQLIPAKRVEQIVQRTRDGGRNCQATL